MTNIPEYLNIAVGCHVDGNYMSVDDLNLDIIGIAQKFGYDLSSYTNTDDAELPDEDDPDYGQLLSEIADDAVDFLNDATLEHRPPFTYWTLDNSCLYLAVDIDGAQEDESVVVNGPKDIQTDYILEINDHGNATLYSVERKEVWSIV